MGIFSSSSKKSTTNTNTSANLSNEGDGNQAVVNSAGAVVSFTDHEAVSQAFDAFSQVMNVGEAQAKRTLEAITKNTDNTVETLKDFAQNLKVGDIESAKYISFAIIAAVLIVLVVYIWKS